MWFPSVSLNPPSICGLSHSRLCSFQGCWSLPTMENNNNQGSKRSHDDGSDAGKKDSNVEESARKRLKDESGRPKVAADPSRGSGTTWSGTAANRPAKPLSTTPESQKDQSGHSVLPSASAHGNSGASWGGTAAVRPAKPLRGTPESQKDQSSRPTIPSSSARSSGSASWNGTFAKRLTKSLSANPEHQKDQSGRPLTPSVSARATPNRHVASSVAPSPSLAIRAIQEMNSGQGSSENTPSPSTQSAPRLPILPKSKPPGSSSGPAVLRPPRNFKFQPPANVLRLVKAPTPAAKQSVSELSRPTRPKSGAQPGVTSSKNPSAVSDGSAAERTFLKPGEKRKREPSTVDVTAADNGSVKTAAAHNAPTDPPMQPTKHPDESIEDFQKRAKAEVRAIQISNNTESNMAILKRDDETKEEHHKRLEALADQKHNEQDRPPFQKKSKDEKMEDFRKRQAEYYNKYRPENSKKPDSMANPKKNEPKSKIPGNNSKSSVLSSIAKPSATSARDSKEFDVAAIQYMNESRDPASGIEYPAPLFEALDGLDVPKKDQSDPEDAKQGCSKYPVYVIVLEQNRRMAYFNVLGTARGMKSANMLALAMFRQEVPKLFPELRESVGLDHEEEKESLAQLQNRLDRDWTKDVWTKATGNICETARLSWYVGRDRDSKGLVTLSAALPRTKYQASIKVIKTKMVL